MTKLQDKLKFSWKRFSESVKKYRSYIRISITIISVVIISIILWLAIPSSNCKANSTGILMPHLTSLKNLLTVHVARLKYAPGQIVDISGNVFNSITGNNTNSTLIIVVNQTAGQSIPWCYSDLPKQRLTHFASIPTTKNGNFSYSSLSNQNIGKYNINIYPIDALQAKYSIPIEVVNPFFTLSAYLLYAGIIFFGLLMITTIVPAKKEAKNQHSDLNLTTYKILRFIFISGMVISILGGLAVTDIELGANSPIGLILQQVLDKNRNPQFDKNELPIREWTINIGGNIVSNDRSFAISIPFYVVSLGLTGGYLRYLSKAASKLYHDEPLKDENANPIEDEENSLNFAIVTEAELSEIALAPLLATVVWLLLSQGQTTSNIYSLAAVSFSIGLITKEIIEGIKRFMARGVSSKIK